MHELNNNIELAGIVFISVPGEAQMHYRPYESHMEGDTLEQIHTLTSGGLNIGTGVFSPISGKILAPAMQAKGTVDLPYGWGEKRYSVLMLFDVTTVFGTEREILTGYTGYSGISNQENLDPQMPIYLNSHTVSKQATYTTPNGQTHSATHGYGMSILNPVTYSPYGEQSNIADTLMRPSDLLTHHQLGISNITMDDGLVDTRSHMLNGYTPARRENSIGSKYLSNLCTAYKSASANNLDIDGIAPSSEPAFLWGAALDSPTVLEKSIGSSALFSRLKGGAVNGNVSSVTVQELMNLWPQINDTNVKQVIHAEVGAPVCKAESVSHWGGKGLETNVAYLLCQSVPAMMSDMLFFKYSFTMTNRINMDGSVSITTTAANFAVDVSDEAKRVQAMELRLTSDIATQVFSRGVGDFMITMDCNIVGSNELQLSINGGQMIPYSAPAYCDSSYSAMVGENGMMLGALSTDLTEMLRVIFDTDGTTADQPLY